MPRCRVCRRQAWIKIPWGNTWFCKEHFIEYFERKVLRTYEKYVRGAHKRVLFAVSGGKDSIAMLYSLAPKLLEKNCEVSVMFIDLGIRGYSEYALKIVENAVNELRIEFKIYDLREETGYTIDDLAETVRSNIFRKSICSLCGTIKRYVYNYVATKYDYDLVLTGHNLDDIYGFIMSNLATGNINDLIKLKPYIPGSKYFVAKAKPLFFNYEYENKLYVTVKELGIVIQKCPHAPIKEESLVMSFKKELYELEKKHPGIGLMFVKNFVKNIQPYITRKEPVEKIVKCNMCGLYSSTNPCSFCRIKLKLEKIFKKS